MIRTRDAGNELIKKCDTPQFSSKNFPSIIVIVDHPPSPAYASEYLVIQLARLS